MVQVVTTQSWGSRIGGAFFGVLIGILLIIGSFILVFWNEGHGLHTAQSLQQTQQVLITVPNSPIDEKNNLKVIYFTGEATTDETLTDSLLDTSATAIRLTRKVEMYQWEEKKESTTEKQMGGSETTTTNYTYNPVWSEDLIDSNSFKETTGHQNPTTMPFKSMIKQAEQVKVGDFNLPTDLINKITNETPVDLSNIDTTNIEAKTDLQVQHNGDDLYLGDSSESPKIGDIRISESQVLPQTVSVIAQQTANGLQAYTAPAGQPVALLTSGEQSPQQMIHDAEVENRMMTWVLRLVSLAMMIFGIALILKPISVLTDVVPIFGTIVGYGTGIVAFMAGLMLWAIATSLAWFVVRPLFAIGLIIIVIAICYFIIARRKQQASANTQPKV